MLTTVLLFVMTLLFAYTWKTCEGMPLSLRALYSVNPAFAFVTKFGSVSSAKIWQNYLDMSDEKALFTQLPLFIDNLRSCLKAGLCLDDALVFTGKKRNWTRAISGPLEHIIFLRGAGVTMIESLERTKNSLPNNYGGRFVKVLLVSLLIGFTTGGNLTMLLDKSQTKIQTSLELQRKIKVYTAQMKMQSLVVALAPVGIAAMLLVLDPQRVQFFVNNFLGVFLLTSMVVLYAIGIKLLIKIGSLDV